MNVRRCRSLETWHERPSRRRSDASGQALMADVLRDDAGRFAATAPAWRENAIGVTSSGRGLNEMSGLAALRIGAGGFGAQGAFAGQCQSLEHVECFMEREVIVQCSVALDDPQPGVFKITDQMAGQVAFGSHQRGGAIRHAQAQVGLPGSGGVARDAALHVSGDGWSYRGPVELDKPFADASASPAARRAVISTRADCAAEQPATPKEPPAK